MPPEPPLPPWAILRLSKPLLRLTDDVSEVPPMATAMPPPTPSPPLVPALLRKAVDLGYHSAALRTDDGFDPLRSRQDFRPLMMDAAMPLPADVFVR
jgi:hypothetical protein